MRVMLILALTFSFIVREGGAQYVGGNLEGSLADENQSPIANAEVSVASPALQGARSVVTNSEGRFYFAGLPVGVYKITLSYIGRRAVVIDGVNVSLGRTASIGTVTAQAAPIAIEPLLIDGATATQDRGSAALGRNLTSDVFESLPIARDYQSVVMLLPQATASPFGEGPNVAGSTGLENSYYIDGAHVTNTWNGAGGTRLPYNFIKEIHVKQGGYEAEHGQALGAIVNVVTFSGGNETDFGVFGFFTNDRVTANRRLGLGEPRIETFSSYDFGAHLGGKLIHDRLWYFIAYNPNFDRKSAIIPGQDLHTDTRTAHSFAGKLTVAASRSTDLILSIVGDPARQDAVVRPPIFGTHASTAGNPDPFLVTYRSGGVSGALRMRTQINPRVALEAWLTDMHETLGDEGTTAVAGAEPMFMDFTTGVLSGGYPWFQRNTSRRSALRSSANVLLQKHTAKIGVEYERVRTRHIWRTTGRWGVLWRDDAGYTSLAWAMNEKLQNRTPTIYVQDSWQAAERLRLNLGLRWSRQTLYGAGDTIAQALDAQWQPRIGVVYQLDESTDARLLASAGRFYAHVPSYEMGNAYVVTPNPVSTFDRDPRLPATVPTSTTEYGGGPPSPKHENIAVDHLDELTLGYQRRVAGRWEASVRAVYRQLREAFGTAYAPDGSGVIGNLGKGDLSFLPDPRRDYRALEISAFTNTRERSHFFASYVLSRTSGNYTGFFGGDTGAPNPGNNFGLQVEAQAVNSTGLLPNDREHVLKLWGSYDFTNRLTGAAYFDVQSGTPLSEYGQSEVIFRPVFLIPRGSGGRTPTLWDLNLRLSYGLQRRIPGKVIIDLQHVGNPRRVIRVNQYRYNGRDPETGEQIAPNVNFLKPVQYQDPMTLRVGVEIGGNKK